MSHFLGTSLREFVTELDNAETSRERLLSGPTVDIYVGRERKLWTLHKNLLCHHSSYFESPGDEAPNEEHLLPEDDPRGFELLVKFLYQGCLDDTSHMNDEDKYYYAVACQKLYQLCDRFDMIYAKNLAMDAYRQNLNVAQLVPDADEINEIYSASPKDSPFRKLMAKIAARQIMDPTMEKDAEDYRACFGNPDFVVDMMNAIRSMSGGILFDDPTNQKDCLQWHDHRDGSHCQAKGKRKRKGLADASKVLQLVPKSVPGGVDVQPIANLPEPPTPRSVPAPPPQPVRTSATKRAGRASKSPRKLALRNGTAETIQDPNGQPVPADKIRDDHCESTEETQRVALQPSHRATTSLTNGVIEEPSDGLVKTGLVQAKARSSERALRNANAECDVGNGPEKPNRVKGVVMFLNSQPSCIAGTSGGWNRQALPPNSKQDSGRIQTI